MSKELPLKFRVYLPDTDEMRYDVTGFEHGKENKMNGVFVYGQFYLIRDCVVMQSTGSFDCEGKEIYDGDILSIVDETGGYPYEPEYIPYGSLGSIEESVGDVMFLRGDCWYIGGNIQDGLFDVINRYSYYKVIGNIYENPDLLDNAKE